jgi:hypothetical protein
LNFALTFLLVSEQSISFVFERCHFAFQLIHFELGVVLLRGSVIVLAEDVLENFNLLFLLSHNQPEVQALLAQ